MIRDRRGLRANKEFRANEVNKVPEELPGPRGAIGPAGPQGPKGDPGNANVVLYEFGQYTFTNTLNLDLSVSRQTVDNSLLLVYYNPVPEDQTAWYAVPGLGASFNYQTRYFIYQISTSPSIYRLAIRTIRFDGSAVYGSAVTFRKIRVIFAEASSVISAQANGQIALDNYQSVKAALNIID